MTIVGGIDNFIFPPLSFYLKIMKNCIKCGKKTKFSLNYDIDCPSIPTCAKCEKAVRLGLVMLLHGEDEFLKEHTKKWVKSLI